MCNKTEKNNTTYEEQSAVALVDAVLDSTELINDAAVLLDKAVDGLKLTPKLHELLTVEKARRDLHNAVMALHICTSIDNYMRVVMLDYGRNMSENDDE